jgi:flagellar protein FliO/FliZ
VDSLILAARVGLSLAAVLGLMWWLSRRMQSSTLMRRRRRESLTVLGRQQLGKQSGVALIEASGRRLVIGYGEQGVTLLHDAGEAPEPEENVDESTSHQDGLDGELISLTNSEASSASLVSRAAMSAPAPARSTSARMADARRPRSPLEGSILAPDTWRKAVVAAQERTTRRS